VIEAFQIGIGSLLAITTQVCEMSLDLDANVLVSETAPITSLIQRMGRCNRHLKNAGPGEVYLYSPEDEKPYSPEDLTGVNDFVAALNNQIASQQDLDNLLIEFGCNTKEVEKYTAFLGDRAWAQSRAKELADIKETSIQSILDSDIDRYFELRKTKQPIDGLLLPVPRYPEGLARQDERIGRFPFVARGTHYDPEYGFAKHPREMIL
jgi:CRISPR-associated endonuclease/helicase Cas3